ncbi:MAG: hypothetical protein WD404_07730 [Solirubrobacterales bacterium]
MPAERRGLDPPLRQAWSINTHALIEFPPAIANGVAYVINKYGNGKAVRLSDRKVLWEVKVHPSDHGKPTDVTAPVYHEGRVYGAFLDGNVAAGDAETGGPVPGTAVVIGRTVYTSSFKTDKTIGLDARSGRKTFEVGQAGLHPRSSPTVAAST